MRKIVSGKIKSIDVLIKKEKANFYGEEIESIEYLIKLENNTTEYLTRNSFNLKEGDIVDICLADNQINKNDAKKNGIIINEKVSTKLLYNFKSIKMMRGISYFSSLSIAYVLTKVIISVPITDLLSIILYSMIMLGLGCSLIMVEKLCKEMQLSKEDIKVLESYKNDFNIKNEIANQIKLKENILL